MGFGDGKGNSQNVTKISELNSKEISLLDRNVPTHNLGEERSVGFINYEIGIRGKRNLESASKKMVINKSSDLIEGSKNDFRKFRKQANEIDKIKKNWNEKMKKLAEDGYNQKENENIRLEKQKLDDLDFLKQQKVPGPFTTVEEVKSFLESEDESKEKNHRLYIEVRFQKNTTQSLKKDSSVFQ